MLGAATIGQVPFSRLLPISFVKEIFLSFQLNLLKLQSIHLIDKLGTPLSLLDAALGLGVLDVELLDSCDHRLPVVSLDLEVVVRMHGCGAHLLAERGHACGHQVCV